VAHPARVYDYWLGGHVDLMAALPSGSHLAISHPALEINPDQQEAQRRYNERVATPQTLRTRAEVARFFAGMGMVELVGARGQGRHAYRLRRVEPARRLHDPRRLRRAVDRGRQVLAAPNGIG
jgi:hypothetical protein